MAGNLKEVIWKLNVCLHFGFPNERETVSFLLTVFLHQLPETKRSWWKWLGCPCGKAWEPGRPFLLFERISIRGDWDSISLKRWKVNSNFEKKKYGSWNQEKQLLKVQCKLPQAGRWGLTVRPEPVNKAGAWATPQGPLQFISHFRMKLGLLPRERARLHGPLVSPRSERPAWPQVVGGKGPEKRGHLGAHFLQSVLRKEKQPERTLLALPLLPET